MSDYAIVSQNGLALKDIDNQPIDLCMIAVKNNREAFKYIREQTADICRRACEIDGSLLYECKKCYYTFEVCLAAVKQNGLSVRSVKGTKLPKEQLYAIYLAAVRQNGLALNYVSDQTAELCLAAVKQNGQALQYVHDQTIEICLTAVSHETDIFDNSISKHIDPKLKRYIVKRFVYNNTQ